MTRWLPILLLSVLAACPGGDGPNDDAPPQDDDDATEEVDPRLLDADGDGYCEAPVFCHLEHIEPGDCDDTDVDIHPGADESCDLVDNDCDEAVDEDFDVDEDGYFSAEQCDGVYPLLDCNDFVYFVHPGAPEWCDGTDTDCNGFVDDGLDADGDGWRVCDAPADCDDQDPLVFPGGIETCDGVDENCDGLPDNGPEPEFQDSDADGFTPCQGDCDESSQYSFTIYPGAPGEVCGDGIDTNCDGADCP